MPLKITIRPPRQSLKSGLVRKSLLNAFIRRKTVTCLRSKNRKEKLQQSRESSPTNDHVESASFSCVRKSVKFDDSCKRHDGLRPASKVFDSLVWQYFMSSTCFSLPPIKCRGDIARHFRGRDLEFLSEIRWLLSDLINRLQENMTTHVPVLASGGGSGGRLTFEKHMHSLLTLGDMVNEFIDDKILMRDENSCGSNSSETAESEDFAVFDETCFFLEDEEFDCDFL